MGTRLRLERWTALRFTAALLGLVFAATLLAAFVPARHPMKHKDETNSSKSSTQLPSPPSPNVGADNGSEQAIKLFEAQVAAEEKQLAATKEELDSIDTTAKYMLAIAGIFSIFLAAASWKALEDQRKAASELNAAERKNFEIASEGVMTEAKQAIESVAELRRELEHDFPMFGRMQRNFQTVLISLKAACSKLAPRDDTYSTLQADDVQRILFYENAISTALLLDTKEYRQDLSEIYRFLGMFYGSRYNSGLQDDKSESSNQPSDIERARFYFDRAIEMNSRNYQAYLHAGHFTQYYDNLDLAHASRDYFRRAAGIEANFQRPFISIALIELEAFKNPERAIDALNQARSRNSYDLGSPLPRRETVTYLEACALCQKAGNLIGRERRSCLEQAMEKLETAATKPNVNIRDMFDSDRQEYFECFTEFPDLKERFTNCAIRIARVEESLSGGPE